MERLVIIDHDTHTLYVEDVSDAMLGEYNGEEEEYIKDNYSLSDNFSWDYITSTQYIPNLPIDGPVQPEGIYDIDFRDFID